MDIERFREYCLSMEGVTEKTPFGKFAARYESMLVFYVGGHMFCIIDMDDFSYAVARNRPEVIADLYETRRSCRRMSNMSPKYWIRLDFGGDITDAEILRLIAESHATVAAKYAPRRPHQR